VGQLVIVGTPIGNDGDWSGRAQEALASATLVAAEDTRVARDRLGRVGLRVRLVSFHEHNARARAPDLARDLGDGVLALISDAGMPLISDPGYRLVNACLEAGHAIDVIPGPSAPLAALAASGLPSDRFMFVGFPPRTSSKRKTWLAELLEQPATVIAFESPRRIVATLSDAAEVLGPRPTCLAISLTKQWQRFRRGTLAEVHAQMLADPEDVIGEMTLVIGGAPPRDRSVLDPQVTALVDGLVDAGVSAATIRDVVADVFGLKRRDVYQRALGRDRG
jgi:16S rRNA (cytidine1402-2'-O)-methyltransferase